ncbi:ABC transporter ATP-binding protein [Desulfonatronum thiosulfatophilum]|nr:ABC transporter ATP-binding protein [Desulfonatronum thiosulfatophilum]
MSTDTDPDRLDFEKKDEQHLLSLRQISLTFGGLQALTDISVGVSRGLWTALIGPNGAGKTSLLNVICGLYVPQRGEVLLGERRLDGLAVHQRAALGLARTFQAVQLVLEMNVLDNLLLGLHCRGRVGMLGHLVRSPGSRREEGLVREKGMEVLQRYSLDDVWNSPVGELSLWQRKLLELARSVVGDPRLLLLDEPMGGLTMSEREAMAELLHDLRSRGLSMIMVEHDMDMVMTHTDHVLVLHHGRLLAQGSPQEIQANPEVITAYLGE